MSGAWERWGSVVGTVGGIVGLVGGGISIVDSIYKRPSTAVEAAYPLTLAFDAQAPELTVAFPLALRNNGNGVDFVRLDRILIKTSQGEMSLPPGSLSLAEASEEVGLPIVVKPADGREFACSLKLALSAEEQALLNAVGLKELVLDFGTDRGVRTVSLCFWMSETNAARLFRVTSADARLRILAEDAGCRGR